MDKSARIRQHAAEDGVFLSYFDSNPSATQSAIKPLLILIHGFTGSSRYWQHNIPALTKTYRVIAPDLRGHGNSEKPKHGAHVYRLAMDLRTLINHLGDDESWEGKKEVRVVGGSLGCAVLWAYTALFTSHPFTHMVFVDQSPLQNISLSPPWGQPYCNKGMNNPSAVASLQTTLALSPDTAYRGTISACLSYLSHPSAESAAISDVKRKEDGDFFLGEAKKGNAEWFGQLMADHTALDHRANITACLGSESGSKTKVLVIASSKSGCFWPEGPMSVVGLINGEGKTDDASEKRARGIVVDWGGHWCFWEDPDKFNQLCLGFLAE